ncbi:copper resistance D family protein [Streptomyces pseudovenezuelae]
MLHLLAMAAWLGGLIALAASLFRPPAGRAVPASAVTRFSRLAFTAVVLLVATGLYQAWRQVGSLEALSTTEYGRTLNLKAAVVALALTAAWFSRLWTAQLTREQPQEARSAAPPARVTQAVGVGTSSSSAPGHGAPGTQPPREEADASVPSTSDRGRRGLRRTVAVEAVLGVAVLAITTLLTGTQPSRAEVQNTAAVAAAQEPTARVVNVPFDTGIPNGNGRVQITFAPGRVGDNTVQALLYGADEGVIAVPELRLTLTQQAQKIGPLDAKLVDRGGYWASDRLRLPLPGTWTLNVTVRLTDVDQVTVTKNVTVRETPA